MIIIDEHTNRFAKTHNHGFFPTIDKNSVVIIADGADSRELDEFSKALCHNGLILSFTKVLDAGVHLTEGLDLNKSYDIYSLEPYSF